MKMNQLSREELLKLTLQSPLVEGEIMNVVEEIVEVSYRGLSLHVPHLSYKCTKMETHFTSTDLDDYNISRMYEEYERVKPKIYLDLEKVKELENLGMVFRHTYLNWFTTGGKLSQKHPFPAEIKGKLYCASPGEAEWHPAPTFMEILEDLPMPRHRVTVNWVKNNEVIINYEDIQISGEPLEAIYELCKLILTKNEEKLRED